MARAANSFARPIRSISCDVLIARASFSNGVASTTSPATFLKESKKICVGVVGSPTMRSADCVPIFSSIPIFFVVALEQAEIFRPRIALCLRKLRFEDDQCGFAFARENQSVIALHAPIIR